ncbi:unnamed protein product, partial [Chrysoparadoxa australica]
AKPISRPFFSSKVQGLSAWQHKRLVERRVFSSALPLAVGPSPLDAPAPAPAQGSLDIPLDAPVDAPALEQVKKEHDLYAILEGLESSLGPSGR